MSLELPSKNYKYPYKNLAKRRTVTIEKMTEELAKIEGFRYNELSETWVQCCACEPTVVSDYSHDYNALHRIINGMGKDELKRFQDELCKLLSRDKGDVYVCFYECWKATELQMMEAIIKAKGKWEKECQLKKRNKVLGLIALRYRQGTN